MTNKNKTVTRYVKVEFDISGKQTCAEEFYQAVKFQAAPIRVIVAAGKFTPQEISAAMHGIAAQIDKQLGL